MTAQRGTKRGRDDEGEEQNNDGDRTPRHIKRLRQVRK
jgi:hypothetical protein